MKYFLLLSFIYQTLNVDFKKNTDILKSKKFFSSRLKEIENLTFLQDKIDSQSNMLILFHADWCHHWYINFKIK